MKWCLVKCFSHWAQELLATPLQLNIKLMWTSVADSLCQEKKPSASSELNYTKPKTSK